MNDKQAPQSAETNITAILAGLEALDEAGVPYCHAATKEIERLLTWQRRAGNLLPLIDREAGSALAKEISDLLRMEKS